MIQAQKDASTKEPKPEDQASSAPAPRTVAAAAVRTVHVDPRRSAYVANTLGNPTTVILSEGGSLPESGAYQYHRVALGTQLQHVVTPVQVTGGNSTVVTESSIPVNSRCVVTSSQDLAHILVAVTTTSTLHTIERPATVSVSAGASQQAQTIGTIANVVTSNQRTVGGTILAQSVPQTSLPQRIVLNSGMSDVFVRLSPSAGGAGSSPQFMVLESAAGLVPSSDVTKVHSYSLASAAMSALSSSGNMQKVVLSTTPGQHLQGAGIPHKAILTTPVHGQMRTATKRLSSTMTSNRLDTSSSVNSVNDVMSRLSLVNKLLSGLVSSSEGKIPSIPNSPKQKRIKLDKTLVNKDVVKRKKITDYLTKKLRLLQCKYYNQQAEYFFLKNGGNIMDFIVWKKKCPPDLLEYLRANKFDPHDDMKAISECLLKWHGASNTGFHGDQLQLSKLSSTSSHPQSPSSRVLSSSSSNKSIDRSNSPSKTSRSSTSTQKQLSKQISSVYDSQIGSQEEIVERAKQEAYVMQRVGDLRKEGLWSLKRLPKVAEMPRIKAHWDYLLEEMVWLATDFAQERKWKKAAAKKCARMITKYFQEKEIKAEKAEKEEQMRLRKIASMMAREIKQFWSNIEKLVEYKQQTWLDEKRKKVLDVHLNFIVDQTEKYSSWLTQGMNRSVNDSPVSSRPSSPLPNSNSSASKGTREGSPDFGPESSGSDDEETIKKEEEDLDENEQKEEIKLLQQESEMSFEDFLDTLPPEILNSSASQENSNDAKKESKTDEDEESDKADLDPDDDYEMSGEGEDDEQTILEQEMTEANMDHKKEIAELEAENELSIEELKQKYAIADMPKELHEEFSEESESSSEEKEEIEKNEDNSSQQDINQDKDENPSKEINDIAAAAESFQPKGNTLSTTQVYTKVPFLLKHTLREYQHIGLDWLNAMYDKKLNGILADEMGLGKTIQTISILAHLACEKGVWGPHLIVVPTSVMLNWEMEFKKWCPAFKILTYYGTPKERKLKRVGWTKPNAFHVCITSYKLVVQDHQSFRRKKWKYLILDEAQHIKNFKSQRWQMLLNFQSSHRLLLTGTPLQNNLMELWSLMHFLMPNVFQSHKEFKEWFVNPVTGMIEGSHEYNESLIKRLHKVLRPFLLRRLKCEVEKQLPKKYEHVVVCRLSKRQRYLYDDFMSQTKTKETLATGNFMSVINILMQLRKVCNHPNMFEERPTVSSFLMEGITYHAPSLVHEALQYDPARHVCLYFLNLLLADLEIILTAFAAHRVMRFQTPPRLIIEMDSMPDPPPPCPAVKMKVNFCNSPAPDKPPLAQPPTPVSARPPAPSRLLSSPATNTTSQRLMVFPGQQGIPRTVNPVSAVSQTLGVPGEQQYTLQLVQPGTAVTSLTPLSGLTLQLQSNSPAGNRVQCIQSLIGGIGRMMQSATGAQWLITSVGNSVPEQQLQSVGTTTVAAQATTTTTTAATSIQSVVIGTNIATATVMPQVHKAGNSISPSILTSFNRPPISSTPASSSANQAAHNKPVGRVAPLNVHPPTSTISGAPNNVNHVQAVRSPVVHSLSRPAVRPELDNCDRTSSIFYLESLSQKRQQLRKEKLESLSHINSRRCTACPIYGGDLVDTISFLNKPQPLHEYRHQWGGYLNSESPVFSEENPLLRAQVANPLIDCIKTAAERMIELIDVIKRFVFVVPAVSSPSIKLHVSHPAPSRMNAERRKIEVLENVLSPACAFFHPLLSNMKTQFPELRLIQYDCGKLQRLAFLLRDLKDNHHRVLIFTQMTRMLDILEQFLNYHGHTYLRLDGNTKVEQRQALMERFNADPRIFCFILSTRSGGVGVNLTGADTVIFYDSDWNPTMDAQAQDRCHRIGQTRDVHIYRLISERTIEENILKKANQKRLLGNLAIEGGNFNTAFFKKNTIHELFGFENREDSLKQTDDKSDVVKEGAENFSPSQLEQALGMAEEEMDLQAAKTAHAEAAAELAEFDESIPLDNESRENEEKSPVEEEIEKLMDQLTPVEKYAVQFLESLQEPLSLEQLKLAEEEIEAQKKDWELGRLKALKEIEEKRLEEENPLLFVSDPSNQIFYSENGQEEMPIWAPPTPPTSENDIYLDPCLTFWYEPSHMHEGRLPPVYIKKEPKRQHIDPVISSTATRKQKVRKDDMVNIPRSLFDRPSAAILKMRREVKLQKVKGLMVGASSLTKPVSTFTGLKQPSIVVNKPTPDAYQDKPEWLVHEDFSILQVIQDQQGIPLSLTILMPAHTPNWDLCADVVNSVSRVYRSPRNCKSRYENVIMLREEGKIIYDANPKKPKKTKGIYKTKNNRPMKTGHLYQQDGNASSTSIFHARCKVALEAAQRRKASEPKIQAPKISKATANLSDSGIHYDEPLNPMQIAANRSERIAREKQKNQPGVAQPIQATTQVAGQTVVQVSEHPVSQRQVQQQSTVTVTGTASLIPPQAQAVIASFAQAQQLQQVQLSKANLQPNVAASVTLGKSLTSSIMVNTTPGSAAGTFATITKALGQAGVSSISAQGAVQNAAIAAALSNATGLRNQRTAVSGSGGTTTTMTVQEMVAAATAGQVRNLTTATSGGTSTAPAVVSVAGLTTVQLAAASQRITSATTVPTGVASQINSQITTQRNLTQLSQIQAIRQTALIRQREQQSLKQQQQLKRLQVQQQQQQAAASQATGKVTVGAATAAALTVATQQRVAPQQVTMKPSRPLTDAEMTFVKRQQLQQQKQQQLTTAQILAQAQLQQIQPQQVSIQGGTATLVKTVSAPTSVAIPVSAVTMGGVNINVSLPQGKTAVQTKGASTTITNQQLRQLQLQQQLLNQARKGSKMATNLTQLAKVPGKGSGITSASLSTPVNAVQIVQHNASVGTTQQAKGLQTAMTVQQIQQAMKSMPQNLPVVVTATPSLPGIQHNTATLRGEPGVVTSSVKAQTTTLPSTTLTTSNVLKGTPAVVVGQQQTAAILQQVAASSATLTGQHAVTLAVRATTSGQAQGQQVQIQVQPTAHSSLVTPQAQVVSPQTRIQQLSQNASTINIAPPVAVQSVPQASSILSPAATIVQQMPGADSTIQSPTHVVMHSVAISNSTPAPAVLSSPQTTSVQAVIQAAAARQQQQKASPYTMRLRNPK